MTDSRFALASWSGDDPSSSQSHDEGGEWVSTLDYANPEDSTQIMVATVPRRPSVQTSPRGGGIAATSIEDAMRVGATRAVDMAISLRGRDVVTNDSMRRILNETSDHTTWRRATLNVDSTELSCSIMDVLGVAWCAVAEYPDVYLSVAALSNTSPAELAIVGPA
jgi:hypothetical protein